MPTLTKEFLEQEFVQNKKSTTQIGKEHDIHPNTIRRALVKHGIPPRSRGEAQKLALQNGRAEHPTEGKERSEEEKAKIQRATYERWQGLSDREKAKWSKMKKKEWEAQPKEEIRKKCKLAAKAIRETIEDGSKLERYLRDGLIALGYRVEFHKGNFLLNTKLQTDLLLPTERVCIEIDGPTHYEPIHGEDRLKKQKRADAQKNGLLMGNGYHVIRVKAIYKTLALARMKDYLDLLVTTIRDLKTVKTPSIVHI